MSGQLIPNGDFMEGSSEWTAVYDEVTPPAGATGAMLVLNEDGTVDWQWDFDPPAEEEK